LLDKLLELFKQEAAGGRRRGAALQEAGRAASHAIAAKKAPAAGVSKHLLITIAKAEHTRTLAGLERWAAPGAASKPRWTRAGRRDADAIPPGRVH
jgi:hypothetical protein